MANSSFEELVGRLTARLRIDPELRMDVARELQAHLEDAADEYRRGGYAEDEAAATAVKALGDPAELEELLWQANRKRIAWRRAAKWTARLTLVPAAVVVTFLLAGSLVTGGRMLDFVHGMTSSDFTWNLTAIRSSIEDANLSEEERFILHGDPAATTELERAESIRRRWPDNPIYYGYYISHYLPYSAGWHEDSTLHDLQEVLARLDQGERIEPDNAAYNLIKAALLFRLSSQVVVPDRVEVKDVTAAALPEGVDPAEISYTRSDGELYADHCVEVQITDPKVFERALEEYARAVPKPRCTLHAMDMARLRLEILGQPASMAEYLAQTTLLVNVLLPELAFHRSTGRAVAGYAVDLAGQGDPEQAQRLIQDVEIVAAKIGAEPSTLIELLVARAVHNMAVAHDVCIAKKLSRPQQAAEAQERLFADAEAFDALRRVFTSRDVIDQSGLIGSILMPALPNYQPDLTPLKRAEYAVAERAGLAALLLGIMALTLASGLIAAVGWWRTRGTDQTPKLLFVGWRRMGWICLLAVVLPVGGYVLYAHLLPLGNRKYGLNVEWDRVWLEFMLLGCTMAVLLLSLSFSAIRERAGEAGIAVPKLFRFGRGFAVAAALITSTVIVYELLRRTGQIPAPRITGGPDGASGVGAYLLMLSFLFAAWFISWLAVQSIRLRRLPAQFAHFRRTFFRSSTPIFASAVIVVGVFCGLASIRAESLAMKSAPHFMLSEIDGSSYRLLREQFRDLHAKLLANRAVQTSTANRIQGIEDEIPIRQRPRRSNR